MFFQTKKRIKISVIVPIYNAENYLHKCLDSILNQDAESIEIIAINDCSTDNSLKILNEYNERYPIFNIINHTTNMGAGAARNKAINKARGKYITFIDSDDWLGDEYLNSLCNEAEKTNADIVFSNMLMADNNTQREYGAFRSLIKKYNNTDVAPTDLPCDWRSTAPWMKLFRKDFLTKNKIRFMEDIKLGAEDVPFSWIAYFVAKKISFCENVHYYYNSVPDSLDRCVNENIIEIFDALNFTKDEYQRFDPLYTRHIQLDTLYVSHALYQFTKVTNKSNSETMKLATLFWGNAHKHLNNISTKNIIKNAFLLEREKEYYFDVTSHPNFDLEMQNKYFSRGIN